MEFRPKVNFALRLWSVGGICCNGKSNEVYFLDKFSKVMKVFPESSPARSGNLYYTFCKASQKRPASGLALHEPSGCFYTAIDKEIVGFSISTWATLTSHRPPSSAVEEDAAIVCNVHVTSSKDNPVTYLYYKSSDERDIYRVKIDDDGTLHKEATLFAAGFKRIRGITFDPADNVLVVDNGRRKIEVRFKAFFF